VHAWHTSRAVFSLAEEFVGVLRLSVMIYVDLRHNSSSIIVCSSIADVDSGLRSSSSSSSSNNNNNNSDIGMDNLSIVHKFDWLRMSVFGCRFGGGEQMNQSSGLVTGARGATRRRSLAKTSNYRDENLVYPSCPPVPPSVVVMPADHRQCRRPY